MMDPLFDFTGKVALVTGGSRGLGREMVLALAERGADVVIASRKVENCESVAAEVEALGRRAMPFGYHAADWDECVCCQLDHRRAAQAGICRGSALCNGRVRGTGPDRILSRNRDCVFGRILKI